MSSTLLLFFYIYFYIYIFLYIVFLLSDSWESVAVLQSVALLV